MLLVILGVIIVGIAIAVGILLFSSGSVSSNKEAMINDLSNIASHAYQYKLRLGSMGGGGGRYSGYIIPSKLSSNEDGTFTTSVQPQSITFTATSAQGYGTVQVLLDSTGKLNSFTYTGDFN